MKNLRLIALVGGLGLVVGGVLVFMLTRRDQDSPAPVVTDPVLQPVALEPSTTDVTIRFQHIEPKVKAIGLKAAWSMDEGAGYEFRDISLRRHPAYITGTNWNTTDSGLTASFRQPGRRLGGVYLNGTRWLQIEHQETLQNFGQLTVSAWIKPDRSPAEMQGHAIVQKLKDNQGYALLMGEDGAIRFVVSDINGGEHAVESPQGTVPQGTWVHVLGTADAATGALQVYVNGALSNSVSGAAFTPGNSSADLMIGRSAWLPDAFKGSIDEVVLYDRSLSAAEVTQLYTVGLPKLYTQTRETIDSERRVWTRFKGNDPVPHSIEPDTIFSARYNGTLTSDQGGAPTGMTDPTTTIVPGHFGGAFDAATNAGLTYTSPITSEQGTFEAWFVPVTDSADLQREQKKVVFRAEGSQAWIELGSQNRRWVASLGRGGRVLHTIQSEQQLFHEGRPVHLGLSWGRGAGGGREIALYVNGAEVARTDIDKSVSVFNRRIIVGGLPEASAYGYIDDVRISNRVREWGDIYPRGQATSEVAALDLMDGFDRAEGEAPVLWRGGSKESNWRYAAKRWEDAAVTDDSPFAPQALHQAVATGIHPVFHPDAYGHMSSIEASIAFDTVGNGWAGVFIQAPGGPGTAFGGYSFALNPETNQLRIAVHENGAVVASKVLPYDFPLETHKSYALTLSHINDGVLRGYVDGNSFISMAAATLPTFKEGYAGLITENIAAYFDDVHFSALTPFADGPDPASPDHSLADPSRLIQQRVFADGQGIESAGGYDNLTLNAFRWHKRYGLLPWERTYKNPQPPGFILSADDDVIKPNPPAPWRSEDSAISDLLNVDGNLLMIHRGNPRIGEVSGVAQLGVLTTTTSKFDAVHFTDPNAGVPNDQANILRGHPDTAQQVPHDAPPRDVRFQVNDQGGAYVGNGKVVVFAREFRNHQGGYPWYRRLVYGVYDVNSGRWDNNNEPHYVDWSQMNPDDPAAVFDGIDATPDVTALRDAQTDEYRLFLFHQHSTLAGRPTTGVTGLKFDAQGNIVLDPDYPARETYTKPNEDVTYGERIFFDNGIYYLHYNSDSERIVGDWPDRYALAASLHPHTQPWTNSGDNDRPYFERGAEYDHDNAAIWSGTIFKHRNRYYLYYEAFHQVEDVDAPYQNYDHLQAGSRLGLATGN